MGCSVFCSAFQSFSMFLEWAVRQKAEVNSTAHYLDDFLFMGLAGSGQCAQLLCTFRVLCQELGVPLVKAKTERPSTKLTFLGIEFNSVQQCSRLPAKKPVASQQLLKNGLQARKLTLRELQVLVSHLNFACRVIAPSRAFLRHLYDAMVGLGSPRHQVCVTKDMWEDMDVWLTFLQEFNGISFWRELKLVEADLQVHSDAAGGAGFGLYFRGHW